MGNEGHADNSPTHHVAYVGGGTAVLPSPYAVRTHLFSAGFDNRAQCWDVVLAAPVSPPADSGTSGTSGAQRKQKATRGNHSIRCSAQEANTTLGANPCSNEGRHLERLDHFGSGS